MTMDEEHLKALVPTLGNYDWLTKNEDALKNLFPETWTHTANLQVLPLMWNLKMLGVEYSNNDQLAQVLMMLEKFRIVVRDGALIRRNPNRLFPVKK